MARDPYAVLGVPRNAGAAEIKAAWETRVTAAAQMADLARAKEIDAAYNVLSDERLRQEYDRTGVVPEQRRRLAPDERLVAAMPTGFRTWTPSESEPSPELRRRDLVMSDDTPAPRRRAVNRPLVLLVVLVLLVGAGIGYVESRPSSPPHPVSLRAILAGTGTGGGVAPQHDNSPFFATETGAHPTIHPIAHPTRLFPAVVAPAGVGGFTKLSGDTRWDPCQPIHYVVNGSAPFAQGDQMLHSAIAEVSRLTGLKFVDDGATPETPIAHRRAFDPTQYGDRWSPVLIAWTSGDRISRLGGDVAGLGGGAGWTIRGSSELVTGIVYLDGPQIARLLFAPHVGPQWARSVMLHELGHLVGLGHVHTPTSVMVRRGSPHSAHDYSAADRRGLAWAGSGPCLHFAGTG